MAWKKPYPDPIQKRHLLYPKDERSNEWVRVGQAFLAEERFSDAIEFFGRAKDASGLEQVRRLALAAGDVFLLLSLSRLPGQEVGPAEWLEAARAALEKGKKRYALVAFRNAGKEEEAARLAEEIGDVAAPPKGKE